MSTFRLSMTTPLLRAPALRGLRAYSIQAPAATKTVKWSVPRNSLGSLPVYTDIRHNGSKHIVLIRNVDGDAKALARELQTTLFPSGSPDAQRLKVEVLRERHLALTGSRCKIQVMEWLARRGF